MHKTNYESHTWAVLQQNATNKTPFITRQPNESQTQSERKKITVSKMKKLLLGRSCCVSFQIKKTKILLFTAIGFVKEQSKRF